MTVDLVALDNANANVRKKGTLVVRAQQEFDQAATDAFHKLASLLSPLPVPSGAWDWDPTSATVDPLSSSLVAAFAAGAGFPAYLNAGNAVVRTHASDPGFSVAAKQGMFDSMVHMPLGTKPGCDNDGHLAVLQLDAAGVVARETDFYKAKVVGGKWSADGGGSFNGGAIQESVASNSNAACFPLERGLLTPEDLSPRAVPHPLVVSLNPALIGGPSRFPAQGQSGKGGPLAFGMWFWFPLQVSFAGLGLGLLDLTVCRFVQKCGLFIRDGGSPMNVCGLDCVNRGGNGAAWGSVGVTFSNFVNGYPYAVQLSPAIPWLKLQALQPPELL